MVLQNLSCAEQRPHDRGVLRRDRQERRCVDQPPVTPARGMMHREPGRAHGLARAGRKCHPDKARRSGRRIPRQPGEFLPGGSNRGRPPGHLPRPVHLERFREVGQVRAAVQIRPGRLLGELARVQHVRIVNSAPHQPRQQLGSQQPLIRRHSREPRRKHQHVPLHDLRHQPRHTPDRGRQTPLLHCQPRPLRIETLCQFTPGPDIAMVAVDDQAHKLPEPPSWRVGRPRQPCPGHLVINAHRSPAAAGSHRRRLMIERLDDCQLRLPVRRRLSHVVNQPAIASQRASTKRLREPLGQDSRPIQMINQQMARAARMRRAMRP